MAKLPISLNWFVLARLSFLGQSISVDSRYRHAAFYCNFHWPYDSADLAIQIDMLHFITICIFLCTDFLRNSAYHKAYATDL